MYSTHSRASMPCTHLQQDEELAAGLVALLENLASADLEARAQRGLPLGLGRQQAPGGVAQQALVGADHVPAGQRARLHHKQAPELILGTPQLVGVIQACGCDPDSTRAVRCACRDKCRLGATMHTASAGCWRAQPTCMSQRAPQKALPAHGRLLCHAGLPLLSLRTLLPSRQTLSRSATQRDSPASHPPCRQERCLAGMASLPGARRRLCIAEGPLAHPCQIQSTQLVRAEPKPAASSSSGEEPSQHITQRSAAAVGHPAGDANASAAEQAQNPKHIDS